VQSVSNGLFHVNGENTNLLHFEWGFDLGHVLLNVSLQRRYINWLANDACHVYDCNMYNKLQEGLNGLPLDFV
jgi:hypothetical protein